MVLATKRVDVEARELVDGRYVHHQCDSATLCVAAESPVVHEDADVKIVGEEIPILLVWSPHAHLLSSVPLSTK